MGGRNSVPRTPLQCMLANFKSAFRENYGGPPCDPDTLKMFCINVWPTLGVGWPEEGSANPIIISKVYRVITRDGHWEQYPYIDQWQIAHKAAPPWLKKCQKECVRVCLMKEKNKTNRKIIKTKVFSQEDEEDVNRPPPYAPQPVPPRQNPYPPLPTDMVPRNIQPRKHQQRIKRDVKSEGEEEEETKAESKPISSRTRSQTSLKKTETLAPLREILSHGTDAQGQPIIRPLLQYQPFTTTDLLNWKQQYGPFSKKPNEIVDLFNTIMQTHKPTWGDIQQLLNTLLSLEDREKFKIAKEKVLSRMYPDAANAAQKAIAAAEVDPNWDPNDTQHQTLLAAYRLLCVNSLREAAKGPVNYAKIATIYQEKDESPEAFLTRLVESYKIHTGINIEDPANRYLLNERFISQSAMDVRRKLQKLDGALGKNTSELLEVARKVYLNRDREEEKRHDIKEKKKTEMLALALGGVTLGPNQCAICNEEGHWKRECPRRRTESREVSYGRGRPMFRGRSFRGTPRGAFRGRRGTDRRQPSQSYQREEVIGLAEMEWDD